MSSNNILTPNLWHVFKWANVCLEQKGIRIKMYILEWHKELETGITLVDMQHKEFFMNVNKFIIKTRTGKVSSAISEEFDFLTNYLLYHFQTEETFQVNSNYPNYSVHRAAHKNLTFQVKEIIMKVKMNDYSNESIEQFYTMLINWVDQHILKMDLDFAIYYKQYYPEAIIPV